MGDDDEDDEDMNYTEDDNRSRAVNKKENPDDEFEGEWGYALIKALRGKSPGRRLKRNIFKFGVFQLVCNFSLLMITIQENRNFNGLGYFEDTKYGAGLLNLMWVVSLPSFLFGLVSMAAVRNWASLTTNRTLLSNLMRVYIVVSFLLFVFTLWLTCVLFLMFRGVKDWSEDVTIARIFPYYICTILFLLPYLVSLVYYPLEVSYYIDQIDNGGVIAEPDPPDNFMDLSDVSLFQSCIFVCAMPCVMCIMFTDLIKAIRKAYAKHYADQPGFMSNKHKEKYAAPGEVKKKRRVWRRVWKTLTRWFRGAKKKEVRPDATAPVDIEIGPPAALELADLQVDREKEERLERERAIREREDRKRQQELEEAAAEAEKQRKAELQMQEAARVLNERRQREEEEAAQRERELNGWDRTLAVAKFKTLWATLSTAGSFQCNLKALPAITNLTEHLKKQGFHIVFAAKPSPNDVEVGVCNIRLQEQDPWFMARFLATQSSFSAVMKAENTEQVTAYVKKFALAKVLKIDK